MADELVDVVDEEGDPTGETVMKSVAQAQGIRLRSVHVWLYTSDGRILLQLRASGKKVFPGFYDISVGGHIGAGEEPPVAALRELEEELGVSIPLHSLEFIGRIFYRGTFLQYGLRANEVNFIYFVRLSGSESLRVQESEVAHVVYISIDDFEKDLAAPTPQRNYAPHPEEYALVIENVRKRINQS